MGQKTQGFDKIWKKTLLKLTKIQFTKIRPKKDCHNSKNALVYIKPLANGTFMS